MTDEQAKTGVTIGEEIRCLIDAGWTWDGDKLVHPTYYGMGALGMVETPGLS
jgi:hypothetical protein